MVIQSDKGLSSVDAVLCSVEQAEKQAAGILPAVYINSSLEPSAELGGYNFKAGCFQRRCKGRCSF